MNRAYSDVALGVGIRTVKGDQVGYGFTQELEETAMLKAAAIAATIAAGGPSAAPGRLSWMKAADHYPLKKLLTAVPLAAKLPLVQTVNDRCFALSPLVVKVNASFHDQQKRIMVVTSDGVKAEDLQPRDYLTALVVAEKGGRKEQAGWNLGGRRDFSYFTPEAVDAIAAKAVGDAVLLFDAVQPPAGEMPVVLGPGVTGILLHEAIGHGMEADFNRKKTSTYCTMIGKKVAEPFVTIIDDGTIPSMLGSINFDDEGTPGQKTVLVENGILTSYMHDQISARYYKRASRPATAAARATSTMCSRACATRYMLAGPAAPDDVIRAVRQGHLCAERQQRPGEDRRRRFRLLCFAGPDDRGRQARPPRSRTSTSWATARRCCRTSPWWPTTWSCHQGGTGACGKGGQGVPVGFGQPTCLVKSLTVGGVKS